MQMKINFNIFNTDYVSVSDNQLVTGLNKQYMNRIIMSNIGFNKGMNEWRIRCRSSMQFVLGVFMDPNDNDIHEIKTGRPWFYGRDAELKKAKIWDARFEIEENIKASAVEKYGDGNQLLTDVVIKLNCEKNAVEFILQLMDPKIGENVKHQMNGTYTKKLWFDIHQHTWLGHVYYPILGFYNCDDEFQIIECDCFDCYEISQPAQQAAFYCDCCQEKQ